MTAPTAGSLRGELVSLRPTTDSDAARLTEIRTHPGVAEWWGRWDLDRVQRELINPTEDETETETESETVIFAIEVDGQPIGLIQYSEENDPEYRHASIDIFLDPSSHGRGFGADAVRTVARHLFDDLGHHRLTIDPAAHNGRAIRSSERVGFRPVGILRQYERSPDGRWHDGLLMDLLRDEFA